MTSRPFLLSCSMLILASLTRFGISPWINQLPEDYKRETHYAASVRFRETSTAAWQEFPLLARRVDQTLLTLGSVAIVQGESHWTTEDGTPTYEPIGLYGIDRRSLLNLSDYGDRPRSGQFLFPQHLEKKTYKFWDPYYGGPRSATFDHEAELEGLTTYVFHYIGTGIDDTAGYTILPDVPERYRTISQAEGTLWIEPVSGIVVVMEDSGVTDFVDNTTGEHVADFYHWSARYTDETRREQLALARASRLRILAFETWLPLSLLLLAVLWPLPALRRSSTTAEPDDGRPDAG